MASGRHSKADHLRHEIHPKDARRRRELVEDADRLAAWATHVGVRRLALIGLQPGAVGRWRAAQRLMRSGEKSDCPRARAVVHAMRRARWGQALALLGTIADERRFTTWTETKIDRWGDLITRTVGWAHAKTGQISLICRPVEWTIVENEVSDCGGQAESPDSEGVAIVVSYPRRGHERGLHANDASTATPIPAARGPCRGPGAPQAVSA